MEYKGKMITLSTGIKYAILEQTEYDGKTYVLANEIVDGKLGTDITLFRVDMIDNEPNFVEEQDLSIAELVLNKMSN